MSVVASIQSGFVGHSDVNHLVMFMVDLYKVCVHCVSNVCDGVFNSGLSQSCNYHPGQPLAQYTPVLGYNLVITIT